MSAYSADPKAEHLLRLSDEVSRIAGTLARLSSEPEAREADAGAHPVDVAIDADFVMAVIRARRLREIYFDAALFADPAWDMMLELFHGELTHRRVAVSALSAAAAVPATTALRWITTMVDQGLCIRRNDPLDGRRVFIELSPTTSGALRRYFAKLNQNMVI